MPTIGFCLKSGLLLPGGSSFSFASGRRCEAHYTLALVKNYQLLVWADLTQPMSHHMPVLMPRSNSEDGYQQLLVACFAYLGRKYCFHEVVIFKFSLLRELLSCGSTVSFWSLRVNFASCVSQSHSKLITMSIQSSPIINLLRITNEICHH